MHICQKLCMREILVHIIEDNSINSLQLCSSVGLVFKISVIKGNSELAKYFNRSYFNRLNE